jgi:alpha-1,3-glucosyltransferase
LKYPSSRDIALDYPPFFAYFEKLLSIPAFFIDPKIVDLHNLNYDSWSVIAYQRTTVIITELVLATALLRYVAAVLLLSRFLDNILALPHRFIPGSVDASIQRIISAALFLHPGFLIVDHIHFQYNGFMFGILLWSILMARNVSFLLSCMFGSSSVAIF